MKSNIGKPVFVRGFFMSDFVTRYAFEQRNLDREKIDAIKKDFPALFWLFLDHMLGMNRSTKTVLSYAYDLKTFLVYLAQVFAVSPDQVSAEFLATLKPIDIDITSLFRHLIGQIPILHIISGILRRRQKGIIQTLPQLSQKN